MTTCDNCPYHQGLVERLKSLESRREDDMKRIEKLEDKFSSIRNWILLVAGGIIANLVAILAKG